MSNDNSLDYLEALLNKGKRKPKVKFEYLKPGKQFFRILPSFDPTNRRIEASYSMHWLTGENGKSVKVQCTYYSEKYCPICEAKKATEELLNHAKQTAPEAENTKRLAEAAQKLGVSRSTYYNAVNAAGEHCVLELNSTVSKALEALIIKAHTENNFDAVAINGGVWFEFEKIGKGRDSVRVDYKRITKMVDGEMVDTRDRSALSEDLVARLPQSAVKLNDPKNLYIKTYSAAELADYLKGKPLPNTNYQQGASSSSSSSEDQEESMGNEYQPASPSSNSSLDMSIQTTATTQKTTNESWQNGASTAQTQTTSPSSATLSHAERLKRLANPNG